MQHRQLVTFYSSMSFYYCICLKAFSEDSVSEAMFIEYESPNTSTSYNHHNQLSHLKYMIMTIESIWDSIQVGFLATYAYSIPHNLGSVRDGGQKDENSLPDYNISDSRNSPVAIAGRRCISTSLPAL